MRSHRERTRRTLPALLAGLGLVCAASGAARAQSNSDDQFLIETAVPPNVVILMDNSNEMKHIEWHPAFDPEAGSYGCSDFTNGTVYNYDQTTASAGGGLVTSRASSRRTAETPAVSGRRKMASRCGTGATSTGTSATTPTPT